MLGTDHYIESRPHLVTGVFQLVLSLGIPLHCVFWFSWCFVHHAPLLPICNSSYYWYGRSCELLFVTLLQVIVLLNCRLKDFILRVKMFHFTRNTQSALLNENSTDLSSVVRWIAWREYRIAWRDYRIAANESIYPAQQLQTGCQ